jgi:DNA-directed RNA polymerase specialized sigma24 family protein
MSNTAKTSNDYIPSSYEDLYAYYIRGDGRGNSLCCQIIRSMLKHGTEEEFETLPMDVYLRILETKQLEKFDPTKANFGGVIYYVTRTIVVNHLERKGRNPLTGLNGGSLRETDPEDEEFEPGVYSLDRLFGAEEQDTGAKMDARNLIKDLVTWARSLAATPKTTRDSNLIKVIELLAQEYQPKEIAEELGFTTSTIMNWMGVIRQHVAELRG